MGILKKTLLWEGSTVQGSTVRHRELDSILYNKVYGKKYEKEWISA